MTEAVAETIWAGILGAGALVWLLAARSWVRTFAAKGAAVVTGRVTVDQDAGAVSTRIARELARDGGDVRGRIESATEDALRATIRPVAIPGVRGAAPSAGARLDCRLARTTGGTTVEYTIDARAMGRGLGRLGAVLLVLGVGALLAAWYLVPRFVIPSENPAVRWQVVQTIHVVHFLWPPFLVAMIARRTRRAVLDRLADLLANLPYV